MPFLNGITALLIYQLIGEVLVRWLKLSIPGPVLGMTLLFISLLLYKRVPLALETASAALLSHLSLLFIPAGVGLILYFDALSKEWLPILVTLVASTLISMALIGLSMQQLMKWFKPKAEPNDESN
ncbi:CidA/LrgA family protein [uncultured Thiothrix sp.]|uniref:CidA/LrgA family protein n=1 Tax=uncultured Thiothrix sp. TaxID=223185 RepID=UPI002631F267|nr:CidA/LrgA family protein [uncultured Thiothrix sp.]